MAGKVNTFSKGQIVIRTHGQTTCVTHRQTTLDWFCKTCSDVICAKCISTTHSGHKFVQLTEETPNIKNRIRKYVNDTENTKLHQIQQEIKSTEDSLRKHLDHFDGLAVKVKKQGEKLKEKIDILISQTLSRVKNIEEEHTNLLISYRTVLETKLEVLKRQVNMCKTSLQTGTDIQLFDVASTFDTQPELPTKPSISTAKFSPNECPDKSLEQALGTVVLPVPNQSAGNSQAYTDTAESHGPKPQHPKSEARPSASVQTHSEGHGYRSSGAMKFPKVERKGKYLIFNKELTNLQPWEYQEALKTLLDPPSAQIGRAQQETAQSHAKVLSTWKPPCDITSICPAGDEGMWTCDNSDNVTLISNQGRIEKQRLNPVSVRDICISPTTHNLWACSHVDNSVTELSSGTFTFRFKASDTPRCICVTRDDHVLVGMKHKIVKYDFGGEVVQEVTTSRSGKSIVCTPWKMSQCPVSENVAVVDRDRALDGGNDKPHIVVLNKQLQQLYRYGRPQHNSVPGSRQFVPFDPCDVTYDRLGQLVIADRDNRSLHLLGSNGQYLRCIYNGVGAAWFVSVDKKEVLWAVFSYGGKQVSLIQYE